MRWTEEQLKTHQGKKGGMPNATPFSSEKSTPQLSANEKRTKGLQALGRLKAGQMNKTEQRFNNYLLGLLHVGQIAWFKFEGIKLMLANNTSLTVDFAVMNSEGVIEMIDVKGAKAMITDDAKAKMKIAAAMYPFVFKYAYPIAEKDGGGWKIEEI